MRSKLFLTCLLALVLGLGACTVDTYKSGDNAMSYMTAEMVDMKVKDRDVISIVNDSNIALPFKKGLSVSQQLARPDTIYRLLMYYNRVGNQPITIYGNDMVSVVKPVQPDAAKTTKTDPVVLKSAWMSYNGKYLNMSLGLIGGVSDGKTHLIDITNDGCQKDAEGNDCYRFSLRHDQNGIPQYYTSDCFLSLPLADYTPGTHITLAITTSEGTKEKEFVIKK